MIIGMTAKPRHPWRIYMMEAAGLGGFVLFAGLLSILLEHPDMQVMQSWLKDYPLLRRVPLAVIMGGYIIGVILLIGKRSGAHINPAVTWTFYRLGRISFYDAAWYTIAQFAGASAAALLLKATVGKWFGHPLINYGANAPKPPHTNTEAFIAEFIITLVLMLVTLFVITSKKLEKKIALITGIFITLYLVFELPFSGMSLNPARSFAGALAANDWSILWIYFVSPVGASLLAAEAFLLYRKRRPDKANPDYKELPYYPPQEENPASGEPANLYTNPPIILMKPIH